MGWGWRWGVGGGGGDLRSVMEFSAVNRLFCQRKIIEI